TSSVSLTAVGTGTITNGNASSQITTAVLNLTTDGGDIGESGGNGPITTNATSLTANASTTGDVFINDSAASVTLKGSNSGDNFNLTMTGVNGGIVLGDGGAATVNGTSSVSLTATGTGTITNGNAGSQITTVVLNLTTGGGNIGQSAGNGPITTNATTLTANAGTTGDVFINDSATSVTLTGTNSGDDYHLTMTGVNGSIVLGDGGAETVNGTSSVSLTAVGNGTITNGNVGSQITTAMLTLATGGGDIGESGGNGPIETNATSLSANAGTTGDVFIEDSATSVTLKGTNSANNYSLQMTGDISGNGSIVLGTSGNPVDVKGTTSVFLCAIG